MKKGTISVGTIFQVIGWLFISIGAFVGYFIPTNKWISYVLAGIGFFLLGIGEFIK